MQSFKAEVYSFFFFHANTSSYPSWIASEWGRLGMLVTYQFNHLEMIYKDEITLGHEHVVISKNLKRYLQGKNYFKVK